VGGGLPEDVGGETDCFDLGGAVWVDLEFGVGEYWDDGGDGGDGG